MGLRIVLSVHFLYELVSPKFGCPIHSDFECLLLGYCISLPTINLFADLLLLASSRRARFGGVECRPWAAFPSVGVEVRVNRGKTGRIRPFLDLERDAEGVLLML